MRGPQARKAGSGEMLWEYRGGGGQWGKACERVDIWAGCKRQGRTIVRTAMPNTVLGALLAISNGKASRSQINGGMFSGILSTFWIGLANANF